MTIHSQVHLDKIPRNDVELSEKLLDTFGEHGSKIMEVLRAAATLSDDIDECRLSINLIVEKVSGGATMSVDVDLDAPLVNGLLEMAVSDFGFSVRALNRMQTLDIKTLRDLTEHSPEDLMHTIYFVHSTLDEVRKKLFVEGLFLKGDEDYKPKSF